MIKGPKEIKIGMWLTRCCYLDLYQIKTEAELADAQGNWDWGPRLMGWPTKKEALKELSKMGR